MSHRISMHTWKLLYASFADGKTMAQCAVDANCDAVTAARYIKHGDPARGLDSIEKLVTQHSLATVNKVEEMRQNQLEAVMKGANYILRKQLEVLAKSEVMLNGTPLQNGNVGIDMKEASRHTLNLSRTQGILLKAFRQRDGVTSRTNVPALSATSEQPTTALEQKQLLEERLRVMEKKYLSKHERKLPTKERSRLLAAKIAKARRKKGIAGQQKATATP